VNRPANHPNKGCSIQNGGTMIAASKSGDAERLRKIEGDFQGVTDVSASKTA
jgi:hypothetical protein